MALRYFGVYLLGLTFKVVADCNALRTTFSKKNLLPMVERWWLDVQEFTFDIKYCVGTRMAHVDALSKNPLLILDFAYVDITEADWIMTAQLQDEQLAHVRKILGTNDQNPKTKHYFEEYTLKDNKVFRRLPNKGKACVVPKNARFQICHLYHHDARQLSAEKTLERIKRNYWFTKMRKFVIKYVKACTN